MAASTPPVPLKVVRTRAPQQVKCIRYPNRRFKRQYSPKDVGRIVCRMMTEGRKAGASEPDAGNPAGSFQASEAAATELRIELRRELSKCLDLCPDQQDFDEQEAAVNEQFQLAFVDVIRDNQVVLAVAASVLAALLVLPRVFAFLPRLLPAFASAALPVAARVAVTQVPGILARIEARAAANEALLKIVAGGLR